MLRSLTVKRVVLVGLVVGLALVVGGVLANLAIGSASPDPSESYFFVPGNHGVLHGATKDAYLKYWGQGNVAIYSTSGGEKEIVFPISLPAVLNDQRGRVEEISFAFRVTGDLTGVSRVWVYRTRTNGSFRTILDESRPGGWTSLDWLELTFPITRDNILSRDDGQLAVRVTSFIPAGSRVDFTGVRVRVVYE